MNTWSDTILLQKETLTNVNPECILLLYISYMHVNIHACPNFVINFIPTKIIF